jgi:threonine aldolase
MAPTSTTRPAPLCGHFDTVSLCLSKGLGAPVGSLLLGRADFIREAKRTRKMLGGAMRQSGLLAAAGQHALQHHVRRLADDHALLRQLAAGLAEAGRSHPVLQGRLAVASAHTNILFTDVHADVAPAFTAWLAQHGVRVTSSLYGGQTRLRWVTHLDVGAAGCGADAGVRSALWHSLILAMDSARITCRADRLCGAASNRRV